jgi:hypothetical protein
VSDVAVYSGGPLTMAGPEFSWILATLERRRTDRSTVLENMRMIRDAYNGDIIVPLPEMNRAEQPAVANLIVTGIDQTAQRVASVMPSVDFPPLRPGIKISEDKARVRTLACESWWEFNRMTAKMARRARWYVGYSSAPAVIRPDYRRQIPCWEIRDPLSAYPAPTQDPDDICPPDCIFTYFRSWAWLRNSYPLQAAILIQQTYTSGLPYGGIPGNTQFEMIEYVDAEVTVLGVLGPKQFGSQWGTSYGTANAGGSTFVELERVPTPGGMCPAVIPQRITLDRPKGQFDDAVGMYSSQARLMALELIAVERGIFPDTYLISRPGETASFIAGPYDGRSGQVNVIKGGDIRDQALNPGFATTNILDRLERNVRVSSGTPAEYGGESPTNIRTGKRGDAVMAAVVDFPVQEAQQSLAAALVEENRRAVAIMKECFGHAKKSFYISKGGTAQAVDYVPDDVFETDVNRVTYSMPGTDSNGLVIGLGQRVGMGLMSKRTAADIDPMIADPILEHDRVTGEALEAAVLASIQAQAQQGAISPSDLNRIAQLVVTNKMSLFDAVDTAQKEAQQRQASSGPLGSPTGPVNPGDPEAQPGLAGPDAGQGVPTAAPPGAGLQNVGDFLRALKRAG